MKDLTIASRWRHYRDDIVLPGHPDIDPVELVGLEMGFYAGARAMLMMVADLSASPHKFEIGMATIDGWLNEVEVHVNKIAGSLAEAVNLTKEGTKR